jgi:GT2 family glycosyltransferase
VSTDPLVAILVLSWNRRDDTLACLRSLRESDYPRVRIIVVDNGSRDDSVSAVRAAHPEVTVVEAGDNLGYAGGNNLALERARQAGADYAWLLNNDTEVAPDCLRRLVEAAEADATVGITGPTIYYFDRPSVIWSAGGAVEWRQGRTRMLALDDVDEGQLGGAPRPVDFVSGCALLLKMPLLERVGALDARFFAYYEETEWCVRVARAGFNVVHVPLAKVWHKAPPAGASASFLVHYYMTRNRLLFLAVTHAGLRPWLCTLALDYPRTLLSWSLRRRWRSRRGHRAVMLRAIYDYFTGNLGRAPWVEGRTSGE